MINIEKRIFSDKAKETKENSNVIVAGQVKNIKLMGSLIFIELRDFKGELQLVALKKEISEELFNKISKVSLESSIAVTTLIFSLSFDCFNFTLYLFFPSSMRNYP